MVSFSILSRFGPSRDHYAPHRLDDFLKANAHAQSREKALVVKFYSRQCRACLRIAAKYRRLALEKRDEIDCYEVESLASRPLVDGLNVTKVPSVQIYDPDGVTRLADGPCMPDDFPRCDLRVLKCRGAFTSLDGLVPISRCRGSFLRRV